MKNLFAYIVFVFTIIFLFGFAYSLNGTDTEGKKIFIDKKCNTCHSIETAAIESKKKDAVDLSKTGDQYNAEFLAKYLAKTEKINDKEHKTILKGTDDEIKALIDWMASLKTEQGK